jgi:hypothetical protein
MGYIGIFVSFLAFFILKEPERKKLNQDSENLENIESI